MKKKDQDVELKFNDAYDDNAENVSNKKEQVILSPDINNKKTAFSGIVVFIIIFSFIALIVSTISYFIGGSNNNSFKSFQRKINTDNKIISVQNGYALTQELVIEKQKFVIRKSNNEFTALPINISSVSEISLSPDSSKVAYINLENTISLGIIVLKGLQVKGFVNYNLDMMTDKEPFQLAFAGKSICPWTQVNWSSNSDRFAFFFCDDSNESSYLAIVNSNPIDVIWVGKKNSQLTKRFVEWLDINRILVSHNGLQINTEILNIDDIIKENN
ncbi:MAG TPA: hypothetical protein PK079_25515 [Leptospiraceae bacterium]|nr:hypothetical protein [Leptospiraceae bacterium]HMW05257.1 hypothetical protein [Leptospiraceae bacterium]HMX31278.1 hypothetical protein [Leptospiraceae bacterium]HMY32084.1 hypothetical protein [Leptospiraceae bacterium]HNA05552.1 hypothetical protein [Leptospiraceae bacterium]